MTPRRLARTAYALAALGAVLAQHAGVAVYCWATGLELTANLEFWLTPLRTLAKSQDQSPAIVALGSAFALASAGMVALLSLRRAQEARFGYLAVALSVVPAVQLPAILLLALARPARDDASPAPATGEACVADVLAGTAVGMGLCVFAVVLAGMITGAYGWGLFVLAPVLMGWVTGYLANRRAVLSRGVTFGLVLVTACLGGLLLVIFALEGIICLIMAAPLAVICAWLGGELGRSMAMARGERARPTAMSLAILPLVIGLESSVPPQLALTNSDSVVVDAPPSAVWRAVTASGDFTVPPSLPYRLGLAYPLSAELRGGGAGAERIGRFSTGVARERVTVWAPERELAFEVLEGPPAMRELSPWKTVHAPHATGYFQTNWTRFALEPLSGDRTRLTVSAAHRLKLDPAPYWEPMARWAIQANTRRVLAHLKTVAEAPTVAQKPLTVALSKSPNRVP